MTTPIYPPIPVEETGSPSPSVTVINQTQVFQVGEYQLEISIDNGSSLVRVISMSLKNSEGALLTGVQIAGTAWVVLDEGNGIPVGDDALKRSVLSPDSPGGSEWDIVFVDGLCELTLERATYELEYYLAVRVMGVITLYAFTLGS